MDNIVLYGGPSGATALSLGSYLLADPGPDFGEAGLLQTQVVESAAAMGGRFSFDKLGVRTMTFPLRLASSAAFGGLTALESLIRMSARPSAYIDIQPHGVASAEAVRFDIIGGRLDPHYGVRLNTIGRRDADLVLQTQPLGYWPTQITLITNTFGPPAIQFAAGIPQASLIGDAISDVQLTITPSIATQWTGGTTWFPDMVAWSLAGKASHVAQWSGGSILTDLSNTIASLTGDQYAAPGSQALLIQHSAATGPFPTTAAFTQLGYLKFTGTGPLLNGRFRVFAWLKHGPSTGALMYVSADLVYDLTRSTGVLRPALASAQPIATLAPAVASGTPGAWGPQASPAYTLLDLGEVQTARPAQDFPAEQRLRIWAAKATTMGISTSQTLLGGIYLLPVGDGPAGVLSQGLYQPTILSPVISAQSLDLNSRPARAAVIAADTPDVLSNVLPYYRGNLPRLGASTVRLDVLIGARRVDGGATGPVILNGAKTFGAGANLMNTATLKYRPTFFFLKGL